MSYQMLYTHVLHALPQAVCHCDGQGVIVASNPAAQALLGYDPETLPQTPWLELIHISDQALIEERWQCLQVGTEVYPCTVRCLCGECSDTSSVYVSVRVAFTATYDAQGVLEHVLLWLTPEAHDTNSIADMPSHAGDVLADVFGAEVFDGRVSTRVVSDFAASDQLAPASEVSSSTSSTQQLLPMNRQWLEERVLERTFFLDDSPAMVVVLDQQWRFVHVSDAAAALVGQTAEQVVGQILWDVLPKMQHNQAGQAFRRAMRTGEPLYYEFLSEDERLQGAWHGVSIMPFADRLLVSIKDITEQKTNQQRLVAAKHRAEVLLDQRNAILESISDYFFILNKDYRFVYANQAVLAILDETSSSILSRTIWDTVSLPAGNPFRQAYVTAINEQVPQRVRYRSSNPKLAGHFLEISLYPFQGGVIGYSRDITESENLRFELKQALADKEAILNSITDGVTVLNRDWVWVYANARVLKQHPDIVGKQYLEKFPEHQGSIFEQKYQQAFDTQVPVFFEAKTDTTHMWYEMRVYPAGDLLTIYTANIDERKRLEQDLLEANHKLQQSESKFRAFFEDSHAAHFMLNLQDPDQPIERFITNAAFDRLFANTQLGQIDRHMTLAEYQAISQHLTDDYYPLLERGLQGEAHLTRLTKCYLNQDGSSFWADVSSFFVYNEQGQPTFGISTIVDISEQKRTQQALEASEAKFRTFFEKSLTPLQLIHVGSDGHAEVTSNRALVRFLGRDLPSVHTMPQDALLDFVVRVSHPEDVAQEQQWLHEMAAGERSAYRFEKRYLHPSGQVRWGDTLVSGARQADGSLLLLTSVQDISEQKRTQQALELSEAKFRNFFERSSVPYTLSIYQGSLEAEDGFVYLYNQAFAELVADTAFLDDLEPTSLPSVNDAIDRITHPDDLVKQDHFEATFAEGQRTGYQLEKRYLKRNGEVMWVNVNVQLWHDDVADAWLAIATVLDITEQKHNEQNLHAVLAQLEASEAKFRTFFEASTTPLFMYIATEDGQATWLFNQAFHDFLQHTAWSDYDHDTMTLEQAVEIIDSITHPEDAALEQHYIAEVFAGTRQGYRMEKRYLNRDGSILWGDLNTVTVHDDAGNMRFNIAIVQDITQIKRTEQALKTSEAKFRAFFENNTTPCTMFIFDPSDDWARGFHFNDAFADFLKDTAFADYSDRLASIEDTLQALTTIGHPEDNALDERFVAEVVAGKRDSYHLEKRYFTRDGGMIWGDISSVFLRDEAGDLSLGMSIVQDITQQKRAEQALKTSEAKFRAFFENNITPCNMFLVDPMGEWEQGFHFNDAFADFLKDTAFADYSHDLVSIEDTLRALTAIGHPEDTALDEHYVAEVMAGKRDSYRFERRYFTRDGGMIWGEISTVFLRDAQGQPTLGMSIVQDITERKRAQAALEKALADKELLLKEVHHRTKNNMQLISSMLALQSRRIADEMAKEALVDSSKRINLLANMHRVLYQTSDGEMIDAGEQISSLLTSLTLGFRKDLTVSQDIATLYLDVHQAIPLGLIANELLTNVFKHAFPENHPEDSLTVRLWQAPADGQADIGVPSHLPDGVEDAVADGVEDAVSNTVDDVISDDNRVVTLEIIDNGVGLAADYPQDHLGMVVVEALAQQLEATFSLSNLPAGGCVAQVCFQKRTVRLK